MGNCLVLLQEEKAKRLIEIMTVDGKILAHRSPLTVHESLSEFPGGHAISETLPVVRRLRTDADEMLSGNLDYLLPPKGQATEEAKAGQGTSMVRIKLVMSKQELKGMLSKGGVLSLGEMISHQLQSRPAAMAGGGGDSARCRSWKPVLESIPEANDLCSWHPPPPSQ